MWFKNLVFYRFTSPFVHSAESLHEKLQESAFSPCSSQEISRSGWVPPMGKLSDQLVHAADGFILLCSKKQEKILPASVIKEFMMEKVEQIEDEQQRKVRKKERDAIKEEVLLELTPKAFSRYQHTFAYIAPEQGLLVVDASSAKRAEDFCSALRKVLGSLPVTIPAMKSAPASIMTAWLAGDETVPTGIELSDECELRDPAEAGGIVRCKQQDLGGEEIATHLKAGKQAVKLALDWRENLTCILGDDLIIRRLKFSDLIQEKAAEMGDADAAAQFDADFSLMTLEITRFIPELMEALGGENQEVYAPAIAV
jgi:recombination associated protein RdgC